MGVMMILTVGRIRVWVSKMRCIYMQGKFAYRCNAVLLIDARMEDWAVHKKDRRMHLRWGIASFSVFILSLSLLLSHLILQLTIR